MSKRQTRVSTSMSCEIHETALRCAVYRDEPVAQYIERALRAAFKSDGTNVVNRDDAVKALLARRAMRRTEREGRRKPTIDHRDYFPVPY